MGAGDGQPLKPAQIIGTATGLVNAANRPFAAEDGVVRSVLIDPRSRGRSGASLRAIKASRLACLLRRSAAPLARKLPPMRPLSGLVVHLCGGCGYVEPPNASPIPEDASLPGRRSPPPQNETTDTGQVDRYQREQAYDGTQMVCDDRALAYRLVHRVIQKEPCRSRG